MGVGCLGHIVAFENHLLYAGLGVQLIMLGRVDGEIQNQTEASRMVEVLEQRHEIGILLV